MWPAVHGRDHHSLTCAALNGAKTGLRRTTAISSDVVMPKFELPTRETRTRLVRFLVVGGGTALLQVAVIAALKRWMNEMVAFSISWVVSTATHYLANRYWALPSSRHDASKQFGEYLFTVAVSYVINLAAFKVCRDGMGLSVEVSTLVAIPPSTVVVFLMLNYRVFRART